MDGLFDGSFHGRVDDGHVHNGDGVDRHSQERAGDCVRLRCYDQLPNTLHLLNMNIMQCLGTCVELKHEHYAVNTLHLMDMNIMQWT